MDVTPRDFKSLASADFATPAKILRKATLLQPCALLEAPPRLGLGVELLQSSALPLGYGAVQP